MNSLKYWNAFNYIPQISPQDIRKLYQHFNTIEQAWKADKKELLKAGLEFRACWELLQQRKKINPEEKIRLLKKHGIKAVALESPSYPPLLKEIYDPPPILYYKGQLPQPEEITLAITGSRKYSPYGQRAVQKISRELIQKNVSLVSGLTYGIDTLAHKIYLENRRPIYIVLNHSLDKIPSLSDPWHAQRIIKNGALISEYPPSQSFLKPDPYAQSRIISGLSLGVVIIEAYCHSNALNTANCALEQNREIFAVPGEIFSLVSLGCHKLIQAGAKLTVCAQDIFEEINILPSQTQAKTTAPTSKKDQEVGPLPNKTCQDILKYLSSSPLSFDKLARLTKLETSVLLINLTKLEIEGIVQNNNGKIIRSL